MSMVYVGEQGGGSSHFGSIILGLVVLLVIVAIGVGIFFMVKGKSSKYSKSGKCDKSQRKYGKNLCKSSKVGKKKGTGSNSGAGAVGKGILSGLFPGISF